MVPFVRGGGVLVALTDGGGGGYFGGGINHWFSRRLGLRFEAIGLVADIYASELRLGLLIQSPAAADESGALTRSPFLKRHS